MKNLILLFVQILFFSTISRGQEKGKYTSIESALNQPDSVIELQLSGISESLPEEIDNLQNLKIVRLINLNSNYDLGDAIGKLSKISTIQELYLYGNMHESLPKEITKLVSLKLINLGTNMSADLVNNIKLLTNLEKLEYVHLRGFGLKELPQEIINIVGLNGLDLGDNQSLNFDQAFNLLANKPGFKSLNLDYNKFEKFPKSITKLQSLENLSMQMMWSKVNKPEVYLILSKLDKLKNLDISGNFLGFLPDEIALMKQLEVLNINGNGIVDDKYNELVERLPNTEIINDLPY